MGTQVSNTVMGMWDFDVLNCPIHTNQNPKTHTPVGMSLLLATVPEGGGLVGPGERETD